LDYSRAVLQTGGANAGPAAVLRSAAPGTRCLYTPAKVTQKGEIIMPHPGFHTLKSASRLCIPALVIAACTFSFAQEPPNCSGLPKADQLRGVLQSVVKEGPSKNGGMGNQEWAVVVTVTASDATSSSAATPAAMNGLAAASLPHRRPTRPMRSAVMITRSPRPIYMPRPNPAEAFTAWPPAPRRTPKPLLAIPPPLERPQIR